MNRRQFINGAVALPLAVVLPTFAAAESFVGIDLGSGEMCTVAFLTARQFQAHEICCVFEIPKTIRAAAAHRSAA